MSKRRSAALGDAPESAVAEPVLGPDDLGVDTRRHLEHGPGRAVPRLDDDVVAVGEPEAVRRVAMHPERIRALDGDQQRVVVRA